MRWVVRFAAAPFLQPTARSAWRRQNPPGLVFQCAQSGCSDGVGMLELNKDNLYIYIYILHITYTCCIIMIHCVLLLFFARAWRAWQCQRQCHCQGPTLLNLACQSTQVNGSLKMQIKVLLRSSCSILKQLLSSFHQMSHYISTISLQEVSSRSMYSILASKPLHGQLKLVPMKIPWLSRMFIQIFNNCCSWLSEAANWRDSIGQKRHAGNALHVLHVDDIGQVQF